MDSGRRILVKAVLWQLSGLAVMAGVAIAMTGSVALGGAMAVVNSAIGFVTYVIYERLWSRVRWGRGDV